jgi:hypothetical protein
MTTHLSEHPQLTESPASATPLKNAVIDLESRARGPRTRGPLSNVDVWAHAWFTLVRHPWSSLVLVPADQHTSAITVARKLADIALDYHHEPIAVYDAEHLAAKDLVELLAEIEERTTEGVRVLIAVPNPLSHYSAVPIARAADAAVLLVGIGKTAFSQARKTIECVGAGSFLGSITIRR